MTRLSSKKVYPAFEEAVKSSSIFPSHLSKEKYLQKHLEVIMRLKNMGIHKRSTYKNLLTQMSAITLLLKAINNFLINTTPGEFGLEKDLTKLPYCETIPTELLKNFKEAIIQVRKKTVSLVIKVIIALDSNRDNKPSNENIYLLTELINAANGLFNDPTNKNCYTQLDKSISALEASSWNYQALFGNLLILAGLASLIFIFPSVTLTYGLTLGLGIAILGTMAAIFGEGLARTSNQRAPKFFKKPLIADSNNLKTSAKQVQTVSGRYNFFNYQLSDCLARDTSSSETTLHNRTPTYQT